MVKPEGIKIIAENRRASHDYHLMDRLEAGIVLWGSEVKSLRDGKANLSDSYVRISNTEAYVLNLHITPYGKSSMSLTDLVPTRERKLLLHQHELQKLYGSLNQKGLTCVPTKLYFKRGIAKLEIALCKGKQIYDKRRDLKKRIHSREMDQAFKASRKRKD